MVKTKSKILVFIILIFFLSGNTFVFGQTNEKNLNSFHSIDLIQKDKNINIVDNYEINPIKDIISQGIIQKGIFNSVVNTNCDGVEKSTIVDFGNYKNIDVDNDQNTGINGDDIRVQYLLLPWFEFEPDFVFGFLFTLYVERIGDEIKDKEFNISMEIGNKDLIFGYWSPNSIGNEIPDSTRVSFIFLFNPFIQTGGFGFYLNPEFLNNNEEKNIVLFAQYKDSGLTRKFSFGFNPPIETQVTITSTRVQGKWEYNFRRDSSLNSEVTTQYTTIENDVRKDIIFSIDELPQEINFLLELTPFSEGGGKFLYECEESYDIEFSVISDELGLCKYALIKNTPRLADIEWMPSRLNGFYSIIIDSDGTDIYLKNSLNNPSINLSIFNFENINLTAYWNLTNPGDFNVIKDPSLNIDLEFFIDDWYAFLTAKPVAKNISFSWLTDVTGYIEYDTDGESLDDIDLLIMGETLGLQTQSELFLAEDFRLDWTLWPPVEWNLEASGNLEFSTINIDLFLQGSWYHLWPW